MKLYAICSPSHAVLRDEWFLPSAKELFEEIIVEEVPQDCKRGEFKTKGWALTVGRKFDLLLRATEENWGGIFVFSDVDIQFFDLDTSYLASLLGDKDIVFQKNSAIDEVCTGFFVCRANENTKNLWKKAKNEIRENWDSYDDQDIINFILGMRRCRLNWNEMYQVSDSWIAKIKLIFLIFFQEKAAKLDINLDYLPEEFYLPKKAWLPGDHLDIPKNIVLHHANWTKGLENKIAQLEYVKDVVSKRLQN